MSTFSNSDPWNVVPEVWNLTTILWNEVIESIRGGGVEDDYFGPKRKKPITESQFIKIYVAVHNEFLTEADRRFFRLANAYPTFEEEVEIRKNVKLVLESATQSGNAAPSPEVILKNVRIGIDKLKKHVEDNSKK